ARCPASPDALRGFHSHHPPRANGCTELHDPSSSFVQPLEGGSMQASARWHRDWCATLGPRLVTGLIVLGAGRTPADAQLGNVPWAMLSHDLHHTGKSAVVGPLTANLKWTQFLHIGFVKSSPMVGKDQMGNPTID